MKTRSLAHFATLALALALSGASSAALAAADNDPLQPMFQMESMDRNKDGMVSKQEFIDTMSKAWDMKAAEMKVKGGRMSADQVRELEKLLGRTLGG